MTSPSPDVDILIGVAGTFKRVPLVSIAAITRVPTTALRESLSRLVFSLLDPSDEGFIEPEGETPEGESGNDRLGDVRDAPETKRIETIERTPTEAPGVAASGTSSPAALTGDVLARVLNDELSRSFYDALVARTNPATIVQALDLTITRRSTIRGRPAAYFTALVRRLSSSDHA